MYKLKIFIVIFFISIFGWHSISHLVSTPLLSDAGVFASGAFHIIKGKVLYKEVWDHKPPMVYFINGIGLWFFGFQSNSIRLVERFFAVMGVLLLFLIIKKTYNNILLSTTGCILFVFHFYQPWLVAQGNLTEEYAAIFILGGITFSHFAVESTKYSHALCFGAGILFSAGAFTKEPFVLSSVPWFFYCIARTPNRKYRKPGRLKFALSFICGGLTTFSVLLAYFLYNDAMKDWLDVVSFNLRYCATYRFSKNYNLAGIFMSTVMPLYTYVISLTVTVKIAFMVGLLSVFIKPFQKKYNYLPIVFVCAFFMDYLGTSISGRNFSHYYMQIVSSYILVSISGVACLVDLIDRLKIRKRLLLPTTTIILLCVLLDYPVFQKRAISLHKQWGKTEKVFNIVNFIKQHSTESDFIWDTTADLANFYLETQRRSPTKYYYIYDGLFIDTLQSTADEKLASLKENLCKYPPKFIIGTDLSFLKTHDLVDWFYKNYSKTSVTDSFPMDKIEINLYVRNIFGST